MNKNIMLVRHTIAIIIHNNIRRITLQFPAAANGPTVMIFGIGMDIGDRTLIFRKSRSKVKVKYPQKTAFSGPILGQTFR